MGGEHPGARHRPGRTPHRHGAVGRPGHAPGRRSLAPSPRCGPRCGRAGDSCYHGPSARAPPPVALAGTPTTAPAPRAGSRTINDRRTTTNTFQITGVTDPQAVAQRVSRILAEQRARERDAQHPQDVED